MGKQNEFSSPKRALRYPVKVAKHIYHLPHLRVELEAKNAELKEEFLGLNHRNAELRQESENWYRILGEQQEEAKRRMQVMDDRITDAMHQLTIMNEKLVAAASSVADKNKQAANTAASSSEQLIADEHLLDRFYVEFEKWFRGSEAEVKQRQSVYLPYFTQSGLDSKKFPVIDIGCGNGEFVELLHENKIRAIGLDLNKAMIDRVKEKGLEGEQGDALSYLRKQKANSLMAVTGFHIVEHIPFLDLVRIFNECYRVLAPGGFVLFETPNPENVIVGSCNFYNDPSHLHPLPPAFLELVMKTRGFAQTEIKKLHPLKVKIEAKDPLVQEMAQRFFGPQDYSVIAHK
jgi:SAM-dependent methyltransferase